MVSVGVAGIVSNIAAGWLVDRGGTDLLYLICGIGSLTLGALAPWILPAVTSRGEAIPEAALTSETLT